MAPSFRSSAPYTGLREEKVADSSPRLAGRCGYCGAALEAKTTRRRFCGDPCRWAAWKRERESKARAPVERALATLLARVETAVEEARKALGRREDW